MAMFKITREVNSIEELAELLQKHMGEKITVEVSKKDSGAKKFFTGNAIDSINIKKNAYHGSVIGFTPKSDGMDYCVATTGEYTPNYLVNQVLGRTGIIDIMVAKLIWGNGKDFFSQIDTFFEKELDGQLVDDGFINSMKSLFKGKTVLDD